MKIAARDFFDKRGHVNMRRARVHARRVIAIEAAIGLVHRRYIAPTMLRMAVDYAITQAEEGSSRDFSMRHNPLSTAGSSLPAAPGLSP